jgi:hypothetical protein
LISQSRGLGDVYKRQQYEVKLVTPAGGYLSTQKFDPEWIRGVTVDGGFLMNQGLRAPIVKPENAFLLEVTRVN